MKKLDIKSTIFGFLICVMLTSIIVGASLLYKANEIEFKPTKKEWEVANVEEAINDLYERQDKNYTMGLIAQGASGAVAAMILPVQTNYTKIILTSTSCDTGNTANYYFLNNTFQKRTNIELNKEYEIGDDYYQLLVEKTAGKTWCALRYTLYN